MWINCKDRLPELLDNVITYRPDPGLVTHATYIAGDFQTIGTCLNRTPGEWVMLGGEITHWQPLPDPPTKD